MPFECRVKRMLRRFQFTVSQVVFCGSSIRDYLFSQSDLYLSTTLAYGSGVSNMFGDTPTQRVVLFAPTDAAWTVAATTLGELQASEALSIDLALD